MEASAARRLGRVGRHLVGCSGVVVVRPPPDNVTNVPLSYSDQNDELCVTISSLHSHGTMGTEDCVLLCSRGLLLKVRTMLL